MFGPAVTLSERFFQETTRRPVPLDMRVLRALKKSPLGLVPLHVADVPPRLPERTAPRGLASCGALFCALEDEESASVSYTQLGRRFEFGAPVFPVRLPNLPLPMNLSPLRCPFLFALALLLAAPPLAAPPLWAQDLPLAELEMPLDGVTGYDESVPRPEAVIGHEIGARHTRPSQVVDYFEAVAEASGRVVLESHGRTYEGRPLIHAFVTAPERIGRLDEVRQANAQLVESPGEVSDADLAERPAVVLMGYSIHGDEASGTEAALLLLYHLAAGQGPAIDEILENEVVIIDPMFNPDGRDRFADWVNGNRGEVATTDPQNREHNQPWPGGRTNHYLFDLNRDWLPAQHPESQGRVDLFQRWHPQVLTDFHEMGPNATYFFQPGIPSRTNPNTPDENQELTAEIATYHARALDEIGSLYYTEESFDDFYYGKGSTYPDVNGAVGILFEQASSRALKRETNRGDLHYAFTVRNQFATSLSTLRAVAEMREDLLSYQRDFYAGATDFAEDAEVKAYVISHAGGDRTKAQALAQILQRHNVRLYELAEEFEAENGEDFEAGQAYVVPVDQTQGRLVKAMMERTTEFGDSLFYDVSAWTLPLAFDLDYAEITGDPAGYLGAEVDSVAFSGGEIIGGPTDYAYVMEWGSYFGPRAIYRFQEAGVEPHLMTEGFTAQVGGERRAFPRGAVVIPVGGRAPSGGDVPADSVRAIAERAAERDHVRLYAVESGLTPGGPDLGSRGARVLEKPEVALLTGDGTSAYNAGEVWHLMTERFRIPITLLDVEAMDRRDLGRYNVIVMAGTGYGSGYGGLPMEKLEGWIEEGGTLITLDSATPWAVENDLLGLEERELDLDSLFQDLPYEDLEDAYGAQQIGGSIFRARLDPSHPLAYGYDAEVPFFRSGTTFYDPMEEPAANVATYAEAPRLSGYVSEEMLEQARGSAALVTEEKGGGRIIAFMDNPNFRAFWYGTNGLFLNAVFLGGAL